MNNLQRLIANPITYPRVLARLKPRQTDTKCHLARPQSGAIDWLRLARSFNRMDTHSHLESDLTIATRTDDSYTKRSSAFAPNHFNRGAESESACETY